mmetsp:Transcript_18210/g.58902  ORF Transcript_18210/g.58902 Transcript_18210/m.58902 type:complete len:435 (-) Transcript_18210:326-1630(-)
MPLRGFPRGRAGGAPRARRVCRGRPCGHATPPGYVPLCRGDQPHVQGAPRGPPQVDLRLLVLGRGAQGHGHPGAPPEGGGRTRRGGQQEGRQGPGDVLRVQEGQLQVRGQLQVQPRGPFARGGGGGGGLGRGEQGPGGRVQGDGGTPPRKEDHRLPRQDVPGASHHGGQPALPPRVQGAGLRHHHRRDGALHQPAAGAVLRVGAAAAAPERGPLRRADLRGARGRSGPHLRHHQSGDGRGLRGHQHGLPHRPDLQQGRGVVPAPEAQAHPGGGAGGFLRADLVPADLQDPHGLPRQGGGAGGAHHRAPRQGVGGVRGHPPRPQPRAEVHAAGRLEVRAGVRGDRQGRGGAPGGQRGRVQLHRLQRARCGGRRGDVHGGPRRADQALALHGDQGAAALGHLRGGAARLPAGLLPLRAGALGQRRQGGGDDAAVPA